MIPPGGVHIRQREAAKAARIVGVDYADAVTGFQFKGRHGTAIVQGIIVAAEYREAIEAVLDGMEYAQEQAQNALRSAEALRLWRRFFLGLRIEQRVMGYEIDGQKADLREEVDKEEKHLEEEQMAGGFFPGAELSSIDPTEPRTEYDPVQFSYDGASEGEFIPEFRTRSTMEDGNGFGSALLEQVPVTAKIKRTISLPYTSSFADSGNMAGGFIPDSPGEQGGGFIPEAEDVTSEISQSVKHPGQSDSIDMDMAGVLITDDVPKATEVLQPSERTQIANATMASDSLLREPSQPQPPEIESVPTTAHSDLTSQQTLLPPEPQTANTSQASELAERMETDEADSSDEDRDSLPSEDPEDEDADPDWLVYST
jgi:xeroderma pigmentosum group C-complementing protein